MTIDADRRRHKKSHAYRRLALGRADLPRDHVSIHRRADGLDAADFG